MAYRKREGVRNKAQGCATRSVAVKGSRLAKAACKRRPRNRSADRGGLLVEGGGGAVGGDTGLAAGEWPDSPACGGPKNWTTSWKTDHGHRQGHLRGQCQRGATGLLAGARGSLHNQEDVEDRFLGSGWDVSIRLHNLAPRPREVHKCWNGEDTKLRRSCASGTGTGRPS